MRRGGNIFFAATLLSLLYLIFCVSFDIESDFNIWIFISFYISSIFFIIIKSLDFLFKLYKKKVILRPYDAYKKFIIIFPILTLIKLFFEYLDKFKDSIFIALFNAFLFSLILSFVITAYHRPKRDGWAE